LRLRSRLKFCACWALPKPVKPKNHGLYSRQNKKQRGENQMQNRTRKEQLIVRVTPEERMLIQNKMQQFGTNNFSRYARKMLIDGYVIRLDLSDFQKLSSEVNAIGININQIAKNANTTGKVYESDISKAKEMVEEIWQLLKSSLSDLLSKTR